MTDQTRLKQRLRTDLTTAIKDRDKCGPAPSGWCSRRSREAEVAGTQAIDLTEQQVLDVVIREAKKRREAEEAYAAPAATSWQSRSGPRRRCWPTTCRSR